jgi:dethiobiotin synthetase
VDVDSLRQHVASLLSVNEFTVVEGVGGAAVPIAPGVLVSDFAASIDLPVLVVARTDLGTVNHTLLTAEHLRARGCRVHGMIFTHHHPGGLSLAESTGPSLAADWAQIKNFGTVPFCPELINYATAAAAVAALPVTSDSIVSLTEWLLP